MSITLDNYQAFFLDYQEGKLNSEQLSELSLFLVLHPHLKAELMNFTNIQLLPENQSFNHKAQLKKFAFEEMTVNSLNFEYFCIAYHEHILSAKKSKELLDFSHNSPEALKDFETYQNVFLKPETNVRYLHKKNLYQKPFGKPYLPGIGLRIAALAAGIALLIGIYFSLDRKQNSTSVKPALAITRNVTHPEVKVSPSSTPDKNLNSNRLVQNRSQLKKSGKIQELPIPVVEEVNGGETETIARVPYPELQKIETKTSISNLKEVEPGFDLVEAKTDKNLLATTNQVITNVEEKITTSNIFRINSKKISLFKIAQLGIQGLNKLTDSNMALTEKSDSTGNIMALSFESSIIKYHRSLHN